MPPTYCAGMDESTATIVLPGVPPETGNGFEGLAADAAAVLLRLHDLPAPMTVRHDTVCPECLGRERTLVVSVSVVG